MSKKDRMYYQRHRDKILQKKKIANKRLRRLYPWKNHVVLARQRCTNPNNPNYKQYGGRGIKCLLTMDEAKQIWFRDSGFNLKNPTIDRINNNGDYCLENCRFIENEENSKKSARLCTIKQIKNGKIIKIFESITEVAKILIVQEV